MLQKVFILLLILLPLCINAESKSFNSRDISKISKMVQSKSKAERQKGFSQISSLPPAEKEKAIVLLDSIFNSWKGKHQKASKKIVNLFKGSDKGIEEKEALRKSWEKAAKTAMIYIYDTSIFPNPPGPVSGPYTGYTEVMSKVNRARDLYSNLRSKVDKDLMRLTSLSPLNADKIRDEFLEARTRALELKDQLQLLNSSKRSIHDPNDFYLAMIFLKCKNWKIASTFFYKEKDEFYMKEDKGGGSVLAFPVKYGSPLKGYQRALFFFLYARYVDDYNNKVKAPSSKIERSSVAKNNDYRISLGLCPLQIDSKVTVAMTRHISTIKEMSHTGATEETETLGQRLRLAGYKVKGGAGENLAECALYKAMDDWKWDGGHHRALVQPGAVHIGVFDKNFSGMDIATGEKPILPVYDYLIHFE